MLRHSPNDGTLRLPNDDDDDGDWFLLDCLVRDIAALEFIGSLKK